MITKEIERNIQKLFKLFPDLQDEEKEIFAKNSHILNFNKGETIFKEAAITSHVFFINSGLVKLVREHKNNRTVILDVIPDMRFVGLVSLMGAQQYDVTAQAITDCTILTIHADIFKKIMSKNSAITMQLISNLSTANLNVINHLIEVVQKQLPGRVADVVLFFYNHYQKTEFSFPLGRRELAEFAGTSKESFIRTLSEFKTDKIIEIIDKRTIRIMSIEILEKLSKYG